MASKIDQKCNENGVDFVEMDIANDCIDPAIGSVINSIIFGYRFGKVVTVTCLFFRKRNVIISFWKNSTSFFNAINVVILIIDYKS